MSDSIFTPKTISFLRSLKCNNNKTWFEKHRSEYLEHLKGPCDALIAALDQPLRKSFPTLDVSKRAATRIYRDTRFSSNKTPYKSYVGFVFRDKSIPNKMGPHLYFGFDPSGFLVGSGIYHFEGMQREHFRQEVVSNKRAESFRKVVKAAERQGFEVGGKELKKIPVGFNPEHPNAEFLLHNGCYMGRETDLLKIFYSPKFPEWLVKAFLPARPFYEWMHQMAKTCPKDPRSFFHIEESRERSPLLDAEEF